MKVMDYHEAIFASKLSTTARITALAIGSYYNWSQEAMCWPSNKTLSKATGLAISTIVKAKRELALAGYLEVWRRIDNSNLYKPLIPHSIPIALHVIESDTVQQRVYSQIETNNEYNNEVNNESNNEKNKGFDKPLIPLDINNPDALEYKKELTPAQADELLSW